MSANRFGEPSPPLVPVAAATDCLEEWGPSLWSAYLMELKCAKVCTREVQSHFFALLDLSSPLCNTMPRCNMITDRLCFSARLRSTPPTPRSYYAREFYLRSPFGRPPVPRFVRQSSIWPPVTAHFARATNAVVRCLVEIRNYWKAWPRYSYRGDHRLPGASVSFFMGTS